MPVTRGKGAIPKGRYQWSPLYETSEWKEAVAELHRGLGPQEFLTISLSDTTIAELPLKNANQAFLVALKRYVKGRRLKVDVRSRAGFEGKPEIYCVGR